MMGLTLSHGGRWQQGFAPRTLRAWPDLETSFAVSIGNTSASYGASCSQLGTPAQGFSSSFYLWKLNYTRPGPAFSLTNYLRQLPFGHLCEVAPKTRTLDICATECRVQVIPNSTFPRSWHSIPNQHLPPLTLRSARSWQITPSN